MPVKQILAVGWWLLLITACAPGADVTPTRAPLAQLPLPPAHNPPPTPFIQPSATAPPSLWPTPTATVTPALCAQPGRVETAVFPSLIAGPMNLRLYLPPCYGGDGRLYPILIMLPGNVHTEAIWDELGLPETAETLIHDGQIPPLIIAMPDGGWIANNTSGGPGSYETVILHDLIPYLEAHTCAWPSPRGRAIGGLSRGGYWSLAIAFRHPDQFASVGGHSAALLDTHAGPDLNPQHTGLNNDLGSLRIYLDIGREDYVIHNLLRLHEEMAAASVPHTWVLNEGKHEEAYWITHLSDYLAWYTAPWPMERDQYPGGCQES